MTAGPPVDLYILASISQVAMMLFALYYAYYLMHRIGTFSGWTLMITAFVLFTIRDFASLASVLSTPLAQFATRADEFTMISYRPLPISDGRAYGTLAIGTNGPSEIVGKEPTT
jgi:hypothetical protein